MHPNSTPALAPRNNRLLRQVSELEKLLRRGWFIEFYDPYGRRHGLPTYPFRWAPSGLLTIRQLRAKGLRPGGQQIVAQILWRRGKRVAYLPRRPRPAQAPGYPRPARRHRPGTPGTPHLPDLRS